jgi:hypothetical protein
LKGLEIWKIFSLLECTISAFEEEGESEEIKSLQDFNCRSIRGLDSLKTELAN